MYTDDTNIYYESSSLDKLERTVRELNKLYLWLNVNRLSLNIDKTNIKYLANICGPLLFLIYINDLPNISKILNFYLYTDDTNIYYESSSLDKLERTVRELNKLYLWLNVNRLSLNIDKTNVIVFHPYNKPIKKSITIKINNKAIEEKEYIKYLGVLIDSTLSWKHHVSNISKKISRSIGIMYKLRPFLPLNVLKNVYYSLVYSHCLCNRGMGICLRLKWTSY